MKQGHENIQKGLPLPEGLPADLPAGMTSLYPSRWRNAAVLIPLIEKPDGLHILFEIRSARIRQGSEVCFPGGRIQEGEDSRETAVRETAEELLIEPSQIRVLAPMFRIMGPGGAEVSSWLGLLRDYHGTFSYDEVADVFSLPLTWLREHPPAVYDAEYAARLPEDFPWDKLPGGRAYPWQGIPKKYYFYDTPEAVIWGLTAELLYHSVNRLTVR